MKYAEPNITPQDIMWVDRVLSSKWLTQGGAAQELESRIASYVGAKYAVSFNSATSALFAAYTAVFEPGERVWIPPVTFVATANAAVNAGLDPAFCDFQSGKNVVPVHLGGRYTAASGERVVEDAAHALGSSGPTGKIGSCGDSDICVFSTHAIKNVTTGEGGVAMTNSKKWRDAMVLLREHGRRKGKAVIAGWNFRMSDIQAALGISQMNRIDHMKERRQEIERIYRKGLAGVIEMQPEAPYDTFHHLFVVFTPRRKGLQRHLQRHGIQTAIHYPLVYSHPAHKEAYHVNCDMGERWAKRCLSLPMHNNLKDEDVRMVIEEVKRWK